MSISSIYNNLPYIQKLKDKGHIFTPVSWSMYKTQPTREKIQGALLLVMIVATVAFAIFAAVATFPIIGPGAVGVYVAASFAGGFLYSGIRKLMEMYNKKHPLPVTLNPVKVPEGDLYA